MELALLVVACAVAFTGLLGSATSGALVAVAALALGVQNAVSRRLAVPDLTTTVLTLTLTGIGADHRLTGGTGNRVGRRSASVLAMFVGALAGTLLVLSVGAEWALVTAALLVAGAVLLTRRRGHPEAAPEA